VDAPGLPSFVNLTMLIQTGGSDCQHDTTAIGSQAHILLFKCVRQLKYKHIVLDHRDTSIIPALIEKISVQLLTTHAFHGTHNHTPYHLTDVCTLQDKTQSSFRKHWDFQAKAHFWMVYNLCAKQVLFKPQNFQVGLLFITCMQITLHIEIS